MNPHHEPVDNCCPACQDQGRDEERAAVVGFLTAAALRAEAANRDPKVAEALRVVAARIRNGDQHKPGALIQ